VGSQKLKNLSSLSKAQPMMITNLQKQRKTISHPRRVKEKVPGLNLKNKETMFFLLKDVINKKEINLFKEDNHFLGTKIFSTAIVSILNCSLRPRNEKLRFQRNKYSPQQRMIQSGNNHSHTANCQIKSGHIQQRRERNNQLSISRQHCNNMFDLLNNDVECYTCHNF
jgi:hypothetical protein